MTARFLTSRDGQSVAQWDQRQVAFDRARRVQAALLSHHIPRVSLVGPIPPRRAADDMIEVMQ